MTKKILVIGEKCTDIVTRVVQYTRPELSFPVYTFVGGDVTTGMANNVKDNITSLGCDVIGIHQKGKICKQRIVYDDDNYVKMRFDFENEIEPCNLDVCDLPFNDMIVISDYNKGFLTEEKIEAICDSYSNVILDTKKPLGEWAIGASLIKINYHEYEKMDKELETALWDKLIITMGPRGCLYKNKHYPVKHVRKIDDVGAGDTFLAALAVKLVNGKKIDTAIKYANKAATVAIQKSGTTKVEKKDVR